MAAPGGGGSPPLGGTTETQPPERPGHGRPVQPSGSGEGLPWPLEGVGGGGLPQPPEGSGRPLRHPGGGGAPPPGGNGSGNGDGNGNVNGGGGGQPPPRRGGNGGGDVNSDGNGDGDRDGGGDSPPPSDPGQSQHHQCQRDRWVYIVQGPAGPTGQPGQAGRDGRDGQIPQLPMGMINVPGMARAPLDTTGLENSFKNLGRTMVDVLTLQQQTNVALQDQIRRANETKQEQTLAMQDFTDMTEQ